VTGDGWAPGDRIVNARSQSWRDGEPLRTGTVAKVYEGITWRGGSGRQWSHMATKLSVEWDDWWWPRRSTVIAEHWTKAIESEGPLNANCRKVGTRVVHTSLQAYLDHRPRTGVVIEVKPECEVSRSRPKDIRVLWDYIQPEPGKWINSRQTEASWVWSALCVPLDDTDVDEPVVEPVTVADVARIPEVAELVDAARNVLASTDVAEGSLFDLLRRAVDAFPVPEPEPEPVQPLRPDEV
jgi:hypothetical protein